MRTPIETEHQQFAHVMAAISKLTLGSTCCNMQMLTHWES